MFVIPFPQIDPVIIEVGPLAVRWYAVAWLTGLFAAIAYGKRWVQQTPNLMSPAQVEDFMVWSLLGAMIGGRLGYVFFYKPMEYIANPMDIIKTWEGGMSYHGGLLGVIAAIMLFARKNKLEQWHVSDVVGCSIPITLGIVRIGNFLNGELWGRPAPDLPWAMVFPGGGDIPRHPSQIYEAFLEGAVLFLILRALGQRETIRSRPGILTGAFLIGYGSLRIFVEFFRQPDAHLGFLSFGTTMGQWLSVPMILFGIYCVWRAKPVTPKA
ncbi:MAG: prolipoprotein diacylglyceryl transferase [Alphaproteobacteria bacterium]|nr:prolipoprotein diacylglyceryl transferase [Alphaproteobacteria bacterium]